MSKISSTLTLKVRILDKLRLVMFVLEILKFEIMQFLSPHRAAYEWNVFSFVDSLVAVV
jgi:hypothetical protein